MVQGPPRIITTPDRIGYSGYAYTYAAAAADPNASDVHTWSIIDGPSSMSMDPSTGVLTWAYPQLGLHLVEIEVRDPADLYDRQIFEIEVGLDDEPPVVLVTISPTIVDAGDPVTVTVSASDETEVASVAVTVNGQSVSLDGSGEGSYTPQDPGPYVVEVTATDGEGNTTVVQRLFGARDPSDTSAPDASLAVTEDVEVLEPTDITGTVGDDHLLRYTLSLVNNDDASERTLGEGTTAVTSAVLGTVDPTVLENGLYTLKLEAEDINGTVTTTSTPIRVEGQAKVGLFTLSFMDLSIPVSGIPITVTRTYDSRVKASREFGVGWSLSVTHGRFSHNRMPGDGWYIHETPPPPPVQACAITEQTKTHYTEVRLSDREVYRFEPSLSGPYQSFGACYAHWSWSQTSGRPGATLEVLGNSEVVTSGDQLLSAANFTQWDPQKVRLTTPEGMKVDIDRFKGIEYIEDRNGNGVWFTTNGIVHSSGKGISFVRDGNNRITKIVDPMGYELNYVYDAAGDLKAFIDQEGNRTEFVYDRNHFLEDIINALGVRAVRNEYDAVGHLISTTDANGNTTTIQHDLINRREILTDRLGHTRYLDYDLRGNVVQEVYPGLGEGGADATITRTFNAHGDVLSETDELGHTTTRIYDDRSNLLTETNPLGETSTRTYDQFSRLLSETDPRGYTTTYSNDATGHRVSELRKGQELYTWSYDTHGNPQSACDPRGYCERHVYSTTTGWRVKSFDKNGTPTVYTHDARGMVLTETTTRSVGGQVESLMTTHVYDAAGRETDTIYPDGSTWHVRYDAAGRETARTDPMGQTTTTEYSETGQRSRVTYSDGTTESWTYDAEDQLIAWTDREGQSWSATQDARGRMLSSNLGGTLRTWGYDAAGRRTSITDARGHTRSMAYDAAGRVTQIWDALGNSTSRSYSARGELVSMTDAKDRTTTYTVDALGRTTRTDYADSLYELTAYDAEGNVTSRTDREGRTTSYTHDGNGNLTSVTNPNDETWTFAYDPQGNLVSQTDPNNHTSTFAYDSMGRQTSRQFHIDDPQTRSYDASGRLESLKNYSGAETTYAYDDDGNLVRRTHPDQSSVTMTWSPRGRRQSATDARGTTTYSYTAEGQLESMVNPSGRSLGYTWDDNGNLASRTAAVGSEVWTDTFGYDANNQLVTVESGADTYALSYDETGQLETIAYPNGVTTTYTHDALDRIASITVRDSSAAVLASWAYIRADGDNITRIVEADGTAYDYAYDFADRLVEETLTSSTSVTVHVRVYAYDDAGNRTQVTYTPNGQSPEVTACSHDARDRISACNSDSFTWDDDGRLTSRAGSEGYALTWDSEDRLMRVDYASGAVAEEAYDVDGVRVSETFTPYGQSAETTEYLVDAVRSLSHNVAELDGGAVAVRYVRAGDLLLGLVRGVEKKYFHADQLGSIRALTDDGGDVTDAYAYTPFGGLADHAGSDAQRYRFAGEPFGPEGRLSYNRARWMDPGLGVFGSIDPWEGTTSAPHTLGRYAYAAHNPVFYRDPTGEFSIVGAMVATAIVAVLVTLPDTAFATKGGSKHNLGGASDEFVEALKKIQDAYPKKIVGGKDVNRPMRVKIMDWLERGVRAAAKEGKLQLSKDRDRIWRAAIKTARDGEMGVGAGRKMGILATGWICLQTGTLCHCLHEPIMCYENDLLPWYAK